MRRRNMYYMTGLPGWMRFGYSPGWVGRSASGLGPGAEYMMTGQWPTPQMAAAWQGMQGGQMPPMDMPPTGQMPTPPAPPMGPYGPAMGMPYGPPDPQQQLEMLQQQAEMLQQQLQAVRDQIAAMEGEE